MKAVILSTAISGALGGSVEIVSSDLTSGGRTVENIKGLWGQAFKIFGRDLQVDASYDRAERSSFLKDATLRGSCSKIGYELTTRFEGPTDVKFDTTTDDGTAVEVSGSIDNDGPFVTGGRISKVKASRAASLRGQDCDLELSHDVGASESKLKLSTALGSGVKAIGSLVSASGTSSTSYEFEYDTTLGEGRKLTAKVSPADGSGEIEYVDSSTVDATITANVPLGGTPKLTMSKAWAF